MNGSNPRSTAQFMGHPLHPAIVSYPIAFFTGAFLTDLAFLFLKHAYWANFSFWLLAAGLVTAAAAALAGLTDFLGDRRIRALSDAWMHMIGNVTAVVIELVNLILRLHDHAGLIASPGVYLSGIAFLILGFTGWKGGELVFRHRVGVADGSDGTV